jgi:hypothetical protein
LEGDLGDDAGEVGAGEEEAVERQVVRCFRIHSRRVLSVDGLRRVRGSGLAADGFLRVRGRRRRVLAADGFRWVRSR